MENDQTDLQIDNNFHLNLQMHLTLHVIGERTLKGLHPKAKPHLIQNTNSGKLHFEFWKWGLWKFQ